MNNDLKQRAADECINLYMETHVSELQYKEERLKILWSIGQALYLEERERHENKHT